MCSGNLADWLIFLPRRAEVATCVATTAISVLKKCRITGCGSRKDGARAEKKLA
jgi:hypothetical protein